MSTTNDILKILKNATSSNNANTLVKRNASGDIEVGTVVGALSGNATSATKLTTARTIAGVAFDGTANITLTGSNVGLGNVTNESKATMFTSPSFTGIPTAPTAAAGTSSLQIATTAFVDNAVNSKTTISGNAGSATRLATARTIAGVSFDGTTNIEISAANIGLGNVTNESKSTMFSNPVFTGVPTAPTATAGTSTTQLATTAFVTNAITAKTSVTGNAGSATKLQTPRTIAGVSFDGTANIELTAANVDAVPTARTVNGKALSANISLTASDVGLGSVTNESKATMFTSPVFTGSPTAPTAALGAKTTQIATTAFVDTAIANIKFPDSVDISGKADIASPTFTGIPSAPTATAGTNTTQLATTAFVTTAINNKTSVTGNAATATKLLTARTISLTGGVTGSGSFDGSGNLSIATTLSNSGEYLPLSGGTLTGAIATTENSYWFNNGIYAMDFKNSDIVGLNNLVFADDCNSDSEGIQFPKTGKAGSQLVADYDTVRARDGVLFFNSTAVSLSDHTHSYLPSSGGTLTGSMSVTNGGITINTAGYNFIAPNNYGYMGRDTAGTAQYLLYMNASNQVNVGYSNRALVLDCDSPTVRGGHKIWHAGNHGSGSGLDADTVDGFHASTSSSPNTIVAQDSSGDVNARLFRSSYANQGTISGAMAFRTNNSTDNYIRFCSDTAAIRSWLGAADASHTHSYLPLSGGTVTGSITTGGWFYTTGATGWYSSTYGGGWNMSDTTWIRSYGNKDIYINKMLRADGGLQVGSNGANVNLSSGGTAEVFNLRTNRVQGRSSYDQLYVGDTGACRFDTAGGNFRIYTTGVGIADNGIYIQTNGQIVFKENSVNRHIFNISGTKTGGTMEIEGTVYGMSPVDSPQTLIEYVVYDEKVEEEKVIHLDYIYRKMISKYSVFCSNPNIEVIKHEDFFILKGSGVTDINIKGQRKEEQEYFKIMGGYEHGSEEEVNL